MYDYDCLITEKFLKPPILGFFGFVFLKGIIRQSHKIHVSEIIDALIKK